MKKHTVEYWRGLLKRADGSHLSDYSDRDKVTLNAFIKDIKANVAYDHECDERDGIDHGEVKLDG